MTGTNDGPVASAEDISASEDGGAVTGQLDGSDVDGDNLTYSLVEGPGEGEGSVSINSDGSYSYAPGDDFQSLAAGETQSVTFTYQVDDGQGGTDTAQATVTVTGTNDGPVASDEALAGTEDQTIVFSANELVSNDLDVDGDTLSISSFEQPSGGSIVDNQDGTFTFTPDENWNGETSFTYTVSDGQGGTDTASVAITVAGVADPASLTANDVTGNEDVAFNLDFGIESVDGIETISLSNIPDGAVIIDAEGNEISISGGRAEIELDQIEGLMIRPVANSDEDFSLDLSVTTMDGDDRVTETVSFDVNVTGVADQPLVDAEDVQASAITQTIDVNLSDEMETALAEGGSTPFVLPGGEGLSGAIYDTNDYIGDLSTVDSLINGNSPSALFTSTEVDYRNGNNIGEFLGDDAASSNADLSASAETFAVKLTGLIYLEAGTHTFATTSDDGFRLNVGGETVTEFDGNRAPSTSDGTYEVSESGLYPIEIVYWEQGGGQELNVELNGQTISGDMLYASPPDGVVLEYAGYYSIPEETSGGPAELLVEVPDGATLTAGTDNGDGTWTVAPDEVDGLQMTLAEGDGGPHEISLTVVDDEGNAILSDTFDAGDGAAFTAELDVSAALTDLDGSETLSITMSELPDGAVLSAGSENADGTWILSADDLDGLTISLPTSAEGFSLDVTAFATERDGDTAVSTTTFSITVPELDNEAAGVTMSVSDVTGDEDQAIALNIDIQQLDTDGSENISNITIGGVPTGAVLSAGTDNGDGSWTLEADDLDGLTITPAANSGDDFQLSVSATTIETSSGDTATVTGTVDVTVAGQVDDFDVSVTVGEITIADASVPTEGLVFHLNAKNIDGDGDATNQPGGGSSLNTWKDLSGNDHDASPSGSAPSFDTGSFTGNGGVEFSGSDNDGLTIADDVTINTGTYSEKSFAVTFETGASVDGFQMIYEQGGSARGYSMSIAEDADTGEAKLYAFVWNNREWDSDDQYKVIDLGTVEPNTSYSAAMVHDSTDGTGTFKGYLNGELEGTLTNVGEMRPHSGDVGIGRVSNGSVRPDTLVSSGDGHEFQGSIGEIISWNQALSDADIQELTNHATQDFGTAGGEPGGITFDLDISATLADTDGSETVSITIDDLPGGAVLSAGTDNGDGTWTLSTDELTDLSVTVPTGTADFDLSVITTVTEEDGDTQTATNSVPIDLPSSDQTADGVTLAENDASGAEDTAIPLVFTVTLDDTDGSETVSIVLSDIPDGASLSAGTDNGDGSWTLNMGDIDGLTITPPEDSNTDFDVTVTVTSTEESSGDMETATATLSVQVAGEADSPELSVSVGEGNIVLSGPPQAVAYWNFNETSGDTLNDQIGNHDGTTRADKGEIDLDDQTTLGGEHSAVTANLATGAEFNDKNEQYIEVGHSTSLKPASGSLSLWFNSDERNDGTLASNESFELRITSNRELELTLVDGGETVTISGGDVDRHEWHQVNVSWGEDGLSLYQNGQLIASDQSFTGGLDADTSNWVFGATTYDQNGTGDYFDGHIDDVAIFDEPLNPAQSQELYEMGVDTFMVDGSTTQTGTVYPVDISATLSDSDGSETLAILIADIPAGVMLSAGTDNGDGTWSLSQGELNGLEMTVPNGIQSFDVNVIATASENDGDTQAVSATAAVTVDVVNIQRPDAFDVAGNSGSENLGFQTGDTTINAEGGDDNVYGDNNYYQNSDGDDVVFAGEGNDAVYGGGGADQIDGGAGDDTLYGDLNYHGAQGGDDLIDGGEGNDTVVGGSGEDTIAGGEGNDIIHGDFSGYYSDGGGDDTIYAEAGNDTVYGGDGADTVYGGEGADVLVGGAMGDEAGNWDGSNDTGDLLDGGAGNDTLLGGLGDDTLTGGAGDDVMDGGSGNDIFTFTEGDGDDVADGGAGWLDTVRLDDVTGGPGEGTWSLQLDSGAIEEQAEGYISLSQDASGTITLADGSEMDIQAIERIEW